MHKYAKPRYKTEVNFQLYPSFGKDLTNKQWNLLLDGIKYRYSKMFFIYVRDKGICHLCRNFVPYNEASRDHLIPHSVFRKDKDTYRTHAHYRRAHEHVDNIKLAHLPCNVARGSMSLDEWKERV